MPSQQNCSENKRIVEGEEQRSKIQAAFGSGKLDVTVGDMTSGCEEALPKSLVSTNCGSLAFLPGQQSRQPLVWEEPRVSE